MATDQEEEMTDLKGSQFSGGARKKDDEGVTRTVLDSLEQLRKDQEEIKGMFKSKRAGKKYRRIFVAALVFFVFTCLVAVVVIAVVQRNSFSSSSDANPPASSLSSSSDANAPAMSAPLIQPLPIGQNLGQQSLDSLQEPDPLKKYYFNVGLRNDYLLQECQGPYLKRSFPDMDYALLGYNILKGYPLAVGHDPGFTLPIFSADYRYGTQTADCRYSVPKGLVLIPDVSCITSFSSEVVETKYEFSKALAVSASVSGGGWGVSFSASAGYKESASVVATGQSVFILSKASCNYYYMRLLEDDAPPFHPVFLKWILKLNNTNQDTVYVEFFEKYGTHFLKEVQFGASFTYEHKMSSQDYKTENENNVNVAVSASYSGLFSVGGGFNMDASQKEKASNFQKKVETRTITIGAAPPANGDALTWASTVKESPVPVRYALASVEELFTETFMLGPGIRKYSIDYKNISKNIVNTKKKYCEVLKAKGLVDDCAGLSPGLNLKNTVMFGHFIKVVLSSISKCIDECFKRNNCIAVDFCTHCTSDHYSYNICYMYDEFKTKYAKESEKFESTIIVPEIKQQMILINTAASGIERSLENSTSVTTLRRCFSACLDDLYCVAFTFCACPHKAKQCTLYSDVHLSLFEEDGTSTHFISRHVTDVDTVYPN